MEEQLLKLNTKIKNLEKSLDEKTKEYKELNAKYSRLFARYQNMSNELILLKERVENGKKNNN